MMSITLYFGEPALPAVRDAASLADLQATLKSGSTDEILDAVLSSPLEDLAQGELLLCCSRPKTAIVLDL